MPKSKNRGHREARKPQQELTVPPLVGKARRDYAAPRKSDRSAAKYIATVGLLWDRRRVDRKARKNALARQDAVSANPRLQSLDKVVREQMLAAMPGWSFDHQAKAFVAGGASATAHTTSPISSDELEELLDAVTDLGPQKITLRVAGLTSREAARVRGYLGAGSMLVLVNPRMGEPTFAMSGNTRSR
jgi:hypothetical protein